MRFAADEENDAVRRYISYLLLSLGFQTIGIFWNVIAVWDSNMPDLWHDDWQRLVSKCIITITCIINTTLVYLIRKIDQRQLPDIHRTVWDFAFELFIVLLHIPPWSWGVLTIQDDVWNILGTAKLYLLAELVKINHPIWLRRYEVNAARLEWSKRSHLVGTTFCFSRAITELDPVFIFISLLMLFLGMFITWIYIMERSHRQFELWNMLDHVLSAFFSVPPANHGALQTLTGRNLKMFVGLFSMFYAAVVGWTFGFRVAEKKQFVRDMLYDLDSNLKLQETNAIVIQRWWKRVKGVRKCPKVYLRRSVKSRSVWRVIKAAKRIHNVDIIMDLEATRKELAALTALNSELTKSSEKLKRSNQQMINLVLVLVSTR